MTRRWRRQSLELVSETKFLGPRVRPMARNLGIDSIAYNPNSLRIGTGNLFCPSRELNRAIREFIRLIRESSLDLLTCG
jgi:hypothetical protein